MAATKLSAKFVAVSAEVAGAMGLSPGADKPTLFFLVFRFLARLRILLSIGGGLESSFWRVRAAVIF